MKRTGYDWWKLDHRRFWDSDEVLEMCARGEADVAAVYVFLLGVQAQRGSLPAQDGAVRVLCSRFGDDLWARAWRTLADLFPVEADGRRRNPVQKAELEDVDASRDAARERAAASRIKRAERHAHVTDPPASDADVTCAHVTVQRRGEERRGEEKNPPNPPSGSGSGGSQTEPDPVPAEPERPPPLETALASLPTLDTPAFRAAWAEWEQHRRELRIKPYKPTGLRRCLAQLAEIGPERAAAAIAFSIGKSWQSIHEPKANGHAVGAGSAKPSEPWRPARLFDPERDL